MFEVINESVSNFPKKTKANPTDDILWHIQQVWPKTQDFWWDPRLKIQDPS